MSYDVGVYNPAKIYKRNINKYRISLNKRPGRLFKNRPSRGGALIQGGRLFEGGAY